MIRQSTAPPNRKSEPLVVLNQYDGGIRKHDAAHAICEAPDGTILTAGRTYRNLKSKYDFFTQATREDGTVLWQRFYGPIQSGGDKHYAANYVSAVYRRCDIPDAICSDGLGNVYVVGSSTLDVSDRAMLADRHLGAAVVSYTAKGDLRFATKIPQLPYPNGIVVAPRDTVVALGISHYRTKGMSNLTPMIICTLDANTGRVRKLLNLGINRHPATMRVLKDGNIRIVFHDGDRYDYPDFVFRHLPMKRFPGSWMALTLTPDLRVVEKIRFDVHDQHARLIGAIAEDGTVVTIESYPDETDRLSCWRDGKQLWQQRFPLPQPDDPRRHQRCNSPISISAGTVFVALGDGPGGINGAVQSAINRFDLATGQPLPDLLTPIYPVGTRHWVPEVIYATPTRVLVGGDHYGDAWVGFMPIPPTPTKPSPANPRRTQP